MNSDTFQADQTRKRVDHLSGPAKAELERRYPDTNPSRAIDNLLERLRTLEQVMKLTSNPTEVENVQPQSLRRQLVSGCILANHRDFYRSVSQIRYQPIAA